MSPFSPAREVAGVGPTPMLVLMGIREVRVRVPLALVLLLLTAALTGCAADPAAGEGGRVRLKLGYFANLTHATALLGVAEGTYAQALGDDVDLDTALFNAGPEAVEALFSGAIDAAFIGPSPTVSAHSVSGGEALRVIAGATSGGAFLVVRPPIRSADDLRGRTLATPQLGNTQDVALRSWLAAQGLVTDLRGGGDVAIQPAGNAQILETYRAGAIDGAWVPEPWATRLVLQEGGVVLVDEATLWPNGRYTTTHVVVREAYLRQHPDVVTRLLQGHIAATERINENPAQSKLIVNNALAQIAGKGLDDDVLDAAWANLAFTVDPIAASVRRSADEAVTFGLIKPVDLAGLYALEPLNALLRAAGRQEVTQ